MHLSDSRRSELAAKWLDGTISEAEKLEFLEWYHSQDFEVEVPSEFAENEDQLRAGILNNLVNPHERRLRNFPVRRLWLYVAAAAVLLTIIVTYVLLPGTKNFRNDQLTSIVTKTHNVDSIYPGSEKAVLELEDGSIIILDSTSKGTISDKQNITVIKLNQSQLQYKGGRTSNALVVYNTLSTPKGGQYAVTLSDGTKVWLNASSSLRFPVVFPNEERVVELKGEGYFEVAHDGNRQFKVKVNEVEVLVFGTSFNLMAYADEDEFEATLVEGSLKVATGERAKMLNPGEQAVLRRDGRLRIVTDPDLEKALAWKNGLFSFQGSDIKTIMRQLKRWYDIEVVYEGSVREHFRGAIPRGVEIREVLQMLELTGAVKFRIEGKNVIVGP